MKLTDISILVNERDLTDILMRFVANKNISIKEIKITDEIQIKNISYKIFRNLSVHLKIHGVYNNKIQIRITKISFKGIYIPKSIVDIFIRFFHTDLIDENKLDKHTFVIDLNNLMKNSNLRFNLKNIVVKKRFIHIISKDINININSKNKNLNKNGGIFLKLTQTILRLSGDDIMSFVRDFVKSGNFMISGIDVSQAIYLKGIIIGSFELGDVSLNIKDLRENLLYIQVKIINCVFPGINIEHVPIKIFVKDLLKAFGNLDLDLDINNVRFIDDCIEIRINNFNLDMRKLSSGGSNVFLK